MVINTKNQSEPILPIHTSKASESFTFIKAEVDSEPFLPIHTNRARESFFVIKTFDASKSFSLIKTLVANVLTRVYSEPIIYITAPQISA